jgi:zinc protease
MGFEHLGSHPFGPAMRVERYRLHNGLTLLVQEDHAAPVVSYHTWLKVGSRLEAPRKTGIAHLFEHLMFNETRSLAYGELDRRMEEAGVEVNAATWTDWTYYHADLPREALAMVAAIEAERMSELVLTEVQLEREREVVLNERRQVIDDDVEAAVAELLYKTVFRVHGYGWPTIGWEEDIERLTLADCRAFYRTYYAPNVATLVVVGDVDTAELCALVERAYGALAPAVVPPEPERPEPPQTAERRVQVAKPTVTHKLAVGYRSPALADPDHAPLVLLTEVLFGGRASRVYRRLVREREIAVAVRAHVGSFRDPGVWEMYLTAREGHDAAELAEALDAEIEAVRSAPPTEAELARAQARLELAVLSGLETVGGRAERIGYCETVLGEPGAMFSRLEAYRRATPDALSGAARRWLAAEARSVIEVEPSGGAEA